MLDWVNQFRTEDWSLEMEDGRTIQLLNAAEGDPFQHALGNDGNQQAISA